MIQLDPEHLIALSDVPDLLPRKDGRKVHVSTVYRWARRGVRGKVLESVRLGHNLYTTQEALLRFASRATAASPAAAPAAPRRLRDAERAAREAGL